MTSNLRALVQKHQKLPVFLHILSDKEIAFFRTLNNSKLLL